jgi:hypothetical protein
MFCKYFYGAGESTHGFGDKVGRIGVGDASYKILVMLFN